MHRAYRRVLGGDCQRFGAGDEDELRHSVAMSTVLCILISVVLTVISVAATWPLLELMNTPEDTIQFTYDYVVVIFYGISASVFYNMISGVLRALGDSKTPLYFLIVASVLNVVLDIVFIRYFYMGRCRRCLGHHYFPSSFRFFMPILYG